MNKYPYVIPEQAHLIILDTKSAVCAANNVEDTKQTIHISRSTDFVRNVEECNIHKIIWCDA